MIIRKPAYYDSFRCIAGACPDSCCQQWEIQVDHHTAELYRHLRSPLGVALRNIMQDSDGETILALRNGRCPMWMPDGLCRIQSELGESGLCIVCREFPRLCHDYGSFQEHMLELSCPEAARLIFRGESSWIETPAEGTAPVEYDAADMDFLLYSRSQAVMLLSAGSQSPTDALTQFLLYAATVQNSLDGEPSVASVGSIPACSPEDITRIADFFQGLEILTDAWKDLLGKARLRPLPREAVFLARYLAHRYWLQSISDLDLYGRSKMIVLSVLFVGSLPGDFCRNAQLWSKEIENDCDNMDAILDAVYNQDIFADSNLLGLLKAAGQRTAHI